MLIVIDDLRCGILLDVKTRARAVLATAAGTHFVHDGFSDILYVLLPLWAQEFRLGLTQVGMIRTAYSGAMAAFQLPAGLLAERWGERRLLATGTAVTACGFVAAGAWAGGFASLLGLLLIAGLGSGVQHPLSSSLIAKGTTVAGVGTALALVFAGGALGKFVCGLAAERVGVIRTVVLTEGATTLGIVAVVAAPLPVALAVLLPLGIALNGTSSVLY